MISPLIYWRTLRHLRREQIWGRLDRLRPRKPIAARPAPPLRQTGGGFGAPIYRTGPIRTDASFRFLNRSARVEASGDWNKLGAPKLWLYNLHYFDWLKEAAAPERVAEDAAWIDKWIAENPAGAGNGWEPYPTSLRIVNWVIWLLTYGAANARRLDSLATQARHLAAALEYHLLGNHLFANAKALAFAGAFFDGPEADRWLKQGLDLLERELREQVLADGAHFELSPMYHSVILEDVLDLIGLAQVYPLQLEDPAARLRLKDTAARMLAWLRRMAHPDGEIPYFNDAAFGIAAAPADLIAYAQARGVAAGCLDDTLTILRPSGYAAFSNPRIHLVMDCGRIGPDYLPGHAHADTLAFELSVGRDRLITNSGTSTYAAGADRAWERSTRAHATVEIDGANSAEVWASFRVGRRPNVSAIEAGADGAAEWVACWHDGYSYLPGAPRHHRRIAVEQNRIDVIDRIEGRGRHRVIGVLPVHAGVRVEAAGDRAFSLRTPGGEHVSMSVAGPVQVEMRQGRFASGFGLTVDRPVIEWHWSGVLPVTVHTQFVVCGAEPSPAP